MFGEVLQFRKLSFTKHGTKMALFRYTHVRIFFFYLSRLPASTTRFGFFNFLGINFLLSRVVKKYIKISKCFLFPPKVFCANFALLKKLWAKESNQLISNEWLKVIRCRMLKVLLCYLSTSCCVLHMLLPNSSTWKQIFSFLGKAAFYRNQKLRQPLSFFLSSQNKLTYLYLSVRGTLNLQMPPKAIFGLARWQWLSTSAKVGKETKSEEKTEHKELVVKTAKLAVFLKSYFSRTLCFNNVSFVIAPRFCHEGAYFDEHKRCKRHWGRGQMRPVCRDHLCPSLNGYPKEKRCTLFSFAEDRKEALEVVAYVSNPKWPIVGELGRNNHGEFLYELRLCELQVYHL